MYPEDVVRELIGGELARASDVLSSADIEAQLKALRGPGIPIGTLDGSPEYVLGSIVDVQLGEDGTVYVLDGRYNVVRAYDSNGKYIQSIGGAGSGPGEFVMPQAIALRDGVLAVVEGRLRRISIFRTDEGHRFVHERDLNLSFAPYGLCMDASGSFLVHGFEPGQDDVLFRLTADGRAAAKYGRMYDTDNMIVGYKLSTGKLACDQRAEIAALAPTLLGQLRIYSWSGDPQAVVLAEGFVPIVMTEYADGAVGQTILPDSGFHSTYSLTHGHGNVVVWQARYQTEQSQLDRREYDRVDTFLVDARSGRGVFVGSDIPRVVALRGAFAVTAENDPFPSITLHRLLPEGTSAR